MEVHAVITGDIVNSTKLSSAKEKKLIDTIIKLFRGYKIEFYRGDSFQAYIKTADEALRLSLLTRTAAISMTLTQGENILKSDVRISIGIGKAIMPVRTLKLAKGEAFVLSGRGLDEMPRTDQRLAITCSNILANEGLHVITDYIDTIFRTMTAKQAEVIFELLKGQTQKAIAAKLKKTKSTINQHVSSGQWNEIEKLLTSYKNIINQL